MQHAYLSDQQIDTAAVMQLGAVIKSKAELEIAVHGCPSFLNAALSAALAYQYFCKTGKQPCETPPGCSQLRLGKNQSMKLQKMFQTSQRR